MNSVNAVILLGHVTRDPRLRTTSSGKSVCDFGLALNRRWLGINGDAKQATRHGSQPTHVWMYGCDDVALAALAATRARVIRPPGPQQLPSRAFFVDKGTGAPLAGTWTRPNPLARRPSSG